MEKKNRKSHRSVPKTTYVVDVEKLVYWLLLQDVEIDSLMHQGNGVKVTAILILLSRGLLQKVISHFLRCIALKPNLAVSVMSIILKIRKPSILDMLIHIIHTNIAYQGSTTEGHFTLSTLYCAEAQPSCICNVNNAQNP